MENENNGHGHVLARPDGVKARCGGPALCSECAIEKANLKPDGKIHILPIDGTDVITHAESVLCPCRPVLHYRDLMTGKEVWSHNKLQDSMQ